MKQLLALAGFAAVIGMAAPAYADSADDSFVASLKSAGITFSDQDAAVGAGKWVCDKVNGGTDMSDVVKTLTSKNASLNPDKASKFAAIAANAYCPDAISASSSAPSDTPSATPDATPSAHADGSP